MKDNALFVVRSRNIADGELISSSFSVCRNGTNLFHIADDTITDFYGILKALIHSTDLVLVDMIYDEEGRIYKNTYIIPQEELDLSYCNVIESRITKYYTGDKND